MNTTAKEKQKPTYFSNKYLKTTTAEKNATTNYVYNYINKTKKQNKL